MDEIKLKPCPFCGGKAKVSFANPHFFLKKWHNRLVFAGCPKCGATTSFFNAFNHTGSPIRNEYNTGRAFQRAAEAWNRRVDDDSKGRYDEREAKRCIDCEAFNKSQLLVPQNEHVKWIPCSKKMPKAEEKVWIQTQSGKACFAMYEDGTIPECDSNWSWFDIEYSSWDEDKDSGIIPEGWWEFTEFHPDCEFDCPVDEKVVAWMPLPEPYKGEE